MHRTLIASLSSSASLRALAFPVAACLQRSTSLRISVGIAVPTPVMAPTAPQLTNPWNACVSTPTMRVRLLSPDVMFSAA